MADVIAIINNTTANLSTLDVLSRIPGFQGLVKVGLAVGILILVYIIFLIIRSVTQISYSFRFKRMTKNVEEINKKMDILIEKNKGKKK